MKTPEIDYLGKDFASFRQQMLAALEARSPGWRERNAVDQGIALVEVLAYAADYLSYHQDAVATEAYLETARSRISLRRHARLLDSRLWEGNNARTWVTFEVDHPLTLPRATPLLTRTPGQKRILRPGSAEFLAARTAEPRTFETLHEAHLAPRHNRLPLDTAGTEPTTEPGVQATRARLAGHFPTLRRGAVLIFQAPGSTALLPHAVHLTAEPRLLESATGPATEIRWSAADALPGPWLLHSAADRAPADGDSWHVLGNVVLADDGHTVHEELPPVPAWGAYAPLLGEKGLTWQEPLVSHPLSATGMLEQNPDRALPAIRLFSYPEGALCDPAGGTEEIWYPTRDLLESGPFAPRFVVEIDNEGCARLRFGDGVFGRRPLPGSRFLAAYRLGNGPAGNLGPNTLHHVVTPANGIRKVSNPLAARGGHAAESNEQVRQRTPFAFHRQLRCVADEDYIALARKQPGVRSARVMRQPCPSGTLARLYIQRTAGHPWSRRFRQHIEKTFEPFLLLGTVLEVLPPTKVEIDLALGLTAAPGVAPRAVRDEVTGALAIFFEAAPYTLGETVELAPLLERVRKIAGVAEVVAHTFRRAHDPTVNGLPNGRLEMFPEEVAILRDQAANPAHGSFRVSVEASHVS